MQLSDISEGMTVRIMDEQSEHYFSEGKVLTIMHELFPEKVHIRLCLESGEVVTGYQPAQLDWE